jgi:anaerobic magnesium-protoporphyrin IX monomethyl ester cyclase
MPKVALVFPHFRTRSATEMLFPPLGLAYLAAQLKQRQIACRIFDCTFQTFRQVSQQLLAYQPEIVGLSSMILLSRNTFRFARFVRNHLPQALLVVGGAMPTLYPDYYASQFHLVFRGESDLSFPDFCQAYLSAGASHMSLPHLDLSGYPGLYARSSGLQVDNPVVHYAESQVNRFPIPDRTMFDHATYQRTWHDKTGHRTTSIMITLGCPFECDFCSRPVFGHLYRRRSLDLVFEEIAQIKNLGYDQLWIADDNFTLDLEFLRQFCQRMLAVGLTWTCLSRATGIDDDIARLMKAAGCQRVYLGLETGSNETLKLMNKKTSVEDGLRAVHYFKQAGIQVAGFFIVGYPGETLSSIEQTFQFSLSLPLDEISFNVPFPLPGSSLFDRVSGIDPARDWSRENEVTFVYTTEFDPAWIKRRIRQTMKLFSQRKNGEL